MINKLKETVYKHILTYPTKSDYQIAEDLAVSRSRVYQIRKQLFIAIDHELARNVAGKFLADFQMASDYFKTQIERLEELKDSTRLVFHDTKDKGKFTTREPIGPMGILALEKHQTELWKDILFLARQGEAIEVIRAIQDGRLSEITQAESQIDTKDRAF